MKATRISPPPALSPTTPTTPSPLPSQVSPESFNKLVNTLPTARVATSYANMHTVLDAIDQISFENEWDGSHPAVTDTSLSAFLVSLFHTYATTGTLLTAADADDAAAADDDVDGGDESADGMGGRRSPGPLEALARLYLHLLDDADVDGKRAGLRSAKEAALPVILAAILEVKVPSSMNTRNNFIKHINSSLKNRLVSLRSISVCSSTHVVTVMLPRRPLLPFPQHYPQRALCPPPTHLARTATGSPRPHVRTPSR